MRAEGVRTDAWVWPGRWSGRGRDATAAGRGERVLSSAWQSTRRRGGRAAREGRVPGTTTCAFPRPPSLSRACSARLLGELALPLVLATEASCRPAEREMDSPSEGRVGARLARKSSGWESRGSEGGVRLRGGGAVRPGEGRRDRKLVRAGGGEGRAGEGRALVKGGRGVTSVADAWPGGRREGTTTTAGEGSPRAGRSSLAVEPARGWRGWSTAQRPSVCGRM